MIQFINHKFAGMAFIDRVVRCLICASIQIDLFLMMTLRSHLDIQNLNNLPDVLGD
jgi:hypothetical protein